MTLQELFDAIEKANPGLTEEQLLSLDVKTRASASSGVYNVVGQAHNVEIHNHFARDKNTVVGEIIINSGFIC